MCWLRPILIFWFSLGMTTIGVSQQNYFLTLSTTKARPLAMGGAYTAIEDDIVSASYNPATLSLYQSKKDYRLSAYFNPIAPATVFYEQIFLNRANDQDQMNAQGALQTATLLLKSLVVTAKFVDVALILNEQILDEKKLVEQKRFFKDGDLWDNCYHTLAARAQLADRVAIGVSGSWYRKEIDDRSRHGLGFSYGIMLKPAPNLNVGMAFVDFPDNMSEVRLPLERMVDQTMNIGVAYQPLKSTTLSFDLRNLTEDQRKSVREIHVGVEQDIYSILAIRGGYYQERFTANPTFSGGIAIFDSNLLFSADNQFDHHQFMLNYSFVYQKVDHRILRWHALSVFIRI